MALSFKTSLIQSVQEDSGTNVFFLQADGRQTGDEQVVAKKKIAGQITAPFLCWSVSVLMDIKGSVPRLLLAALPTEI